MATKKIGKNRLDKYYHLAKEQGYRARSAFKLIQINKKYNFLQDSSKVIDLCAAPGSWTQVVQKFQQSRKDRIIIAVDLDKIKPISNVITLQNDITTDECYSNLNEILKSEKVDLVLNDGSPNVGTSWDKDSFVQNELVLHAMRLANEFLRKGGVFVTKVFRSSEMMKLSYVLKKMFERVEMAKPLSSRSESAEIFIVCTNFQGTDLSDDFFDSKKIFRCPETDFEDDKRKGELKFSEFVVSEFPEELLKKYNKIIIDNENDFYKVYTDKDLYSFNDLQQISHGDIRTILRKRIRLLKLKNLYIKPKVIKEDTSNEVIDTEKSKISKIKRALKKMEKENKKNSDYQLLRVLRTEKLRQAVEDKQVRKKNRNLNFFNDEMFEDKNLEENLVANNFNDDEISSDEESFSHSEDERGLIVEYKNDKEEFKNRTVNKFVHDDHENLPDFIEEEEDEHYKMEPTDKNSQKISKRQAKSLEYTTRKIRRAEKFKQKLIEENKDGNVKRINKKAFKPKNNNKRDVVRVRKGRSVNLRRGIRTVDKRMKKDFRKKKKI